MDPATLSVLSLGSTLLGGGISAMGQMASANYQSQVAQNNATIAQRNADYAINAGNVQAEQQDMKTKAMIGEQIAGQGANGLDVNSGSNLNVRQSQAELGRLDTLNILQKAQLKSSSLEADAMNFRAQGQLAESRGAFGAAGSILGTAASVSDKWMTYQQRGIYG